MEEPPKEATEASPAPRAKAQIFNLPNTITLVRILLVPIVVWLLIEAAQGPAADTAWKRWLATAGFVLAIATDGLDGAIARRRGMITNLGKILDPIADKALIGASLITLSLLGDLPWLATGLIVGRELAITVFRLIMVSERVIGASWAGKLKTILQAVTISVYLAPLELLLGDWVLIAASVMLWVTVAVTLLSGIQYLFSALRLEARQSDDSKPA